MKNIKQKETVTGEEKQKTKTARISPNQLLEYLVAFGLIY